MVRFRSRRPATVLWVAVLALRLLGAGALAVTQFDDGDGGRRYGEKCHSIPTGASILAQTGHVRTNNYSA